MRLVRLGALAAVAVLIGVPAVLQAQAAKPNPVEHTVEGRDQCLMCHKAGAMETATDVPADHADRPNETCMWCHAPDAAMLTQEPSAISHDLEGRAQCEMCHGGAMPNIPATPESHEGRSSEYCTLCHSPPS
ncbi:MAG: hypothetical protein PVH40_10305 [Gemmatimonadales bacterium]|jgi:hypothetical protein